MQRSTRKTHILPDRSIRGQEQWMENRASDIPWDTKEVVCRLRSGTWSAPAASVLLLLPIQPRRSPTKVVYKLLRSLLAARTNHNVQQRKSTRRMRKSFIYAVLSEIRRDTRPKRIARVSLSKRRLFASTLEDLYAFLWRFRSNPLAVVTLAQQ